MTNSLRPAFDVTATGRRTTVTFNEPTLDYATAPQVWEALFGLADLAVTDELVVDLCRVAFLNRAGLARLVALHLKVAKADRRLVLENLGPQPYEVVRVTRLDKLLEIRQPVSEDRSIAA